jgi:hypothetical protein
MTHAFLRIKRFDTRIELNPFASSATIKFYIFLGWSLNLETYITSFINFGQVLNLL